MVSQGGGESIPRLQQWVDEGNAFRISSKFTLDDGQDNSINLNPSTDSGTIWIEPPAIDSPDGEAELAIYENADVTDSADDVLQHNMRYDAALENPQTPITRVTNGNLTVSGADQTGVGVVQQGGQLSLSNGVAQRGIWRIVPPTDDISLQITDQSGGTSNEHYINMVLYEGPGVPD